MKNKKKAVENTVDENVIDIDLSGNDSVEENEGSSQDSEEKAEKGSDDVVFRSTLEPEDDTHNDSDSEKENDGEELNDSEIVDIEDETEKKEKAQKAEKKKKSVKTTDDFIRRQKKRKRTRRIVTLLIILGLIIAGVMYVRKKVTEAAEQLMQMQTDSFNTATVEKKTLYDSKDATGTLYALDSRTISTILQQSGAGAMIEKVNVSVGDYVHEGDVLVEFSTENIEKKIAQTREDISQKKKEAAINAADAEREYVNSYSNVANQIQTQSKNVDRALRELYEACDGYGDAKRTLEEIKARETNDQYTDNMKSSDIKAQESAITAAFQKQEAAQRAYDDAVSAQAEAIANQQNSLSTADSTYQKNQLTAGESVKSYQRNLEEYNDSLDDYVVYAPIDGVVTWVNVSEGNRFSSDKVLTIQDNSGYKAEVSVDEYDIPKVKKAYDKAKASGKELEVVVKTEATGDNEYKGHVTLISPTSTTTTGASSAGTSGTSSGSSSSSVTYTVSIELDELDEAFMIGMSAKVAIIVDQSPENALCVPYNAVFEKENGEFYVKVVDESAVQEEEEDDGAAANGIVVENNLGTAAGNNSGKSSGNNSKMGGISKGGKKGIQAFSKEEPFDPDALKPKTKEVKVKKIFDTDYYTAIVPINAGELNEGDEVEVVSEKGEGNDIFSMMMGGPGPDMGP